MTILEASPSLQAVRRVNKATSPSPRQQPSTLWSTLTPHRARILSSETTYSLLLMILFMCGLGPSFSHFSMALTLLCNTFVIWFRSDTHKLLIKETKKKFEDLERLDHSLMDEELAGLQYVFFRPFKESNINNVGVVHWARSHSTAQT